MKQNKTIEHRVEETLNSLDGLQKASPGPFFFTRVMARIEAEEMNLWEKVTAFITRPYVIASVITFVLLLNVTAIFNRSENYDIADQADVSMVDAYKVASTSFYDYTNAEP